MYLYGASGHAKVIIDILHAQGIKIEALVDDNPNVNQLLGYAVLNGQKEFGEAIISIGDNRARKSISEKIVVKEYGTAIHPSSVISPFAKIDSGTVVMQGTVIQSCTSIGQHCIVNTKASLGHDCKISDFVHISPGATLCGGVEVGEGTWIGAGSVVKQGVKIGSWTIVGAGSVVINDLPDNVLAVGNKCKVIKKI